MKKGLGFRVLGLGSRTWAGRPCYGFWALGGLAVCAVVLTAFSAYAITWLVPQNNATGTVGTQMSSGATSLVLDTGQGANFPGTYPYRVVIGDSEIVEVTNKSTDTLTVTRAQEGTSATVHEVGELVSLNMTAGYLTQVQAEVDQKQPLDTTLTALAGGGVAGKVPYWSATNTLTEKTASMQGLVGLARVANSSGVSSDGLVMYWRCGSATSLNDWTGNGYTAPASGTGQSVADGKFGSAITLDGNGYFETTSTSTSSNWATNSATFSLWFNTTTTNDSFLGSYQNTSTPYIRLSQIGTTNNSGVRFTINDGTNTAYTQLQTAKNDGAWHHAVGVINRTEEKIYLYVDGVVVDAAGSAITSYGTLSSSIKLDIGSAGPGSASYKYVGSLDEICIWGRALSAGEVEALYLANRELGLQGGYVDRNIISTGDVTAQGGDFNAGVAGTMRGTVTFNIGGATSPGNAFFKPGDGGIGGSLFSGDDDTPRWLSGSSTPQPADGVKVITSTGASGGNVSLGTHGATQGTLTLNDGSGGNKPGYMVLYSPNGTPHYLFVEDDGTVKIHTGAPTQNSDGAVVGSQS